MSVIEEIRKHPLRLLVVLLTAFIAFTGTCAYGQISNTPQSDQSSVGNTSEPLDVPSPAIQKSDSTNSPDPVPTYKRVPQHRVQLDDPWPAVEQQNTSGADSSNVEAPTDEPTTDAPSNPPTSTSVATPETRGTCGTLHDEKCQE